MLRERRMYLVDYRPAKAVCGGRGSENNFAR
jgi:hypothetical protein